MSSTAGTTSKGARVTARRVFYIPGYDPIHPRRYRELYRKEGAAQAAISGYELTLSARRGAGRYGWQVAGSMDGAATLADVDVLVWSDIVRRSMSHTIGATYLQLVRTAWAYIASGALFRLMRLRKGPVIAALYPVGFLLLQLAIALIVGHLAGTAIALLMGYVMPASGAPLAATAGALAYAVALIAVAWTILRWFKRKDGKFYAYYLMHDYAYSARYRGAIPPALAARMVEFGEDIARALDSDVDEVLVVGHSSGAHLAVSVLADLLRAGRVVPGGPALSFLSLGQVVPMVSFLPDAHRLRADLAYLSQSGALTWVDVTAPGDGCAFALCDPVSVSGVAAPGKRWPLVISAAFTQTLSPARWRELRWKFFRLHSSIFAPLTGPAIMITSALRRVR
ncbi:hypothetical protein [Roseovarius dicentrarchi]|uniref:hypothetical protein n=1 Tax=Roseovarius dicentrarchi TaxID=2250573 RepID=UPI003B82D42C